jgi:hypothetical protein
LSLLRIVCCFAHSKRQLARSFNAFGNVDLFSVCRPFKRLSD